MDDPNCIMPMRDFRVEQAAWWLFRHPEVTDMAVYCYLADLFGLSATDAGEARDLARGVRDLLPTEAAGVLAMNDNPDNDYDDGFPGDRSDVGYKGRIDDSKYNYAAEPPPLLFRLYRDLPETSTKDWLVDGILGMDEFSVFFGEPGSGKSVLVEDLHLHVAAGMDWHGRATKSGLAVYFALERHKLVERRALAFRQRTGHHDIPFAIVPGPINFLDKAAASHIVDTIKRIEDMFSKPLALLGIDTVSAALCGGDENSPKDMGRFVATVRDIQEGVDRLGAHAHILACHHQPHDAVRMRGHGSLLGAVDVTVEVSGKAETTRTATVRKTNDGEEGLRINFALESETIGEGTTAPVVVPVDGPASAPPKGKRAALTPAAIIVLDALREAIAESGAVPPANNHIPDNTKAVASQAWREMAYERSISHSDEPDARKKAFKRAAESLIARKRVGTYGFWVWLT